MSPKVVLMAPPLMDKLRLLGLTDADVAVLAKNQEEHKMITATRFADVHGVAKAWIGHILYIIDDQRRLPWTLDHYAMVLFNMCAHFDDVALTILAFNIMDTKGEGILTLADYQLLVDLLWRVPETERPGAAQAEIGQTFEKLVTGGVQTIPLNKALELGREHPVLMRPLVDLQRRVREHTLGVARWQKLAQQAKEDRKKAEEVRRREYIRSKDIGGVMAYPFTPTPAQQVHLEPKDVTVMRLEKHDVLYVTPGVMALTEVRRMSDVARKAMVPHQVLQKYAKLERFTPGEAKLAAVESVDLWKLDKAEHVKYDPAKHGVARSAPVSAPVSAPSSAPSSPRGGKQPKNKKGSPLKTVHGAKMLEMQLNRWQKEKEAADKKTAAARTEEAEAADADEAKNKALAATKKPSPYNAHSFHNKRIVVEALEEAMAAHRKQGAGGIGAGSRPASAAPAPASSTPTPEAHALRVRIAVDDALTGGDAAAREEPTPKKELLRKLSRKDVRQSRKSTGNT